MGSHILNDKIYNYWGWRFIIISAYVSGERGGLILETPYHLGESLNGVSGLDIDVENKVVQDKLNELREEKATPDEVKMAMKDLGIARFVYAFLLSQLPLCFWFYCIYNWDGLVGLSAMCPLASWYE